MSPRAVRLALAWTLIPLAVSAGGIPRVPRGMARVTAGSFEPLYRDAGRSAVRVAAFAVDTVAVSQADFMAFVARNPKWARGAVSPKLADPQYLSRGGEAASRPATEVSWHAATAYCSARGARLPTTSEWEYAARADETARDAAAGSAFKQRALELALGAKPGAFRLGSGLRNVWGIRDLHGGITEWTSDVNPAFGHAHHNHAGAHDASCASGTVETGDGSDYAAFMRYAFRRNARPDMTAPNVGFRCAVSL